VNIALVEENLPVMGVIYVPVHKELYFAAQGIGAFKKQDCDFRDIVEDILDESELIPMDLEGIEEGVIRVVASRSHPSRETQELIQELEQEYDKVEVVSRGSSLKMCLIAEGSAEVYPRLAPTMEWDTAAGQAICEVAGFQVLEHKTGLPLTYNKENLRNPWFIVS
jgi:3'(2'), 5'-bisphosphate nucleotidase